MATTRLNCFLRQLTRRMAAEQLAEQSDRQLVERLLAGPDEAAFEALVCRHGPMIYRVCWRVLQHAEDSEDAFQATFLLLARKISSIKKRDSLASWLHEVARRIALEGRKHAASRHRHEARAPNPPEAPPDEITWKELRTVLDTELASLPDKLRSPLILCYLEGRSQEEAARQLGWSKSTLLRRLEEARTALGRRLRRKGFVWPAAVLGLLVSDSLAPAALSTKLIGSTVEAAACALVGRTAAGMVSAKVTALTEGVMKAMFTSKLNSVIFAALLAAVLVGGAILTPIGAGSVVLTCALSGAGEPQAKEADHQTAVPKSIVGVGEGVVRVAWSPNGKFLAVVNNIFEVEEREIDGQKKKVGHDNCTLMLWDVEKKEWMPTTVRLGPKVRVESLAVSPDSKTLAFGLLDPTSLSGYEIRLVDVEKGKEKKSFPFDKGRGWLSGVGFTPKGTLAAWGRGESFVNQDGKIESISVVKFFDVDKLEEVDEIKNTRRLACTSFASSSDRKWAAFGYENTILIQDLSENRKTNKAIALEGHSKPIFALAFAVDPKLLVSGSYDNTVKVSDVSNGKVLHTLTTDDQQLNAVALSPDGKTVALGILTRKDEKITGQEVRLFDVQTGKLKRTLKVTGTVQLRTLAFSPDGRTLATGGLGVDAELNTLGDLRLWQLEKK
jgi:RNA polymerase sigma factor (sigma-70 family)